MSIAQGGMAHVWAARRYGSRGFSKLVAIKTTLPHLVRSLDFERMFLDEAHIGGAIHHPNVCEVSDFGEEDGVLFLAMEWIEGGSLADLLHASGRLEPIEPRLAARIAADVCAGLHAAHELADHEGQPRNVIHRDVSPQNVLVSVDGAVKLADFGIAKARGQFHATTATGRISGKLSYMSPEQMTGKPCTRASDLYALGIVLYEMTTGERPFPGDAEIAAVFHSLTQDPTPPSRHVPTYPVVLEEIVLEALARDPAARPASAEKMRMELEDWLALSGPPVTAADVGELVRARLGDVVDERARAIRAAGAELAAADARVDDEPSGTARVRHARERAAAVLVTLAGVALVATAVWRARLIGGGPASTPIVAPTIVAPLTVSGAAASAPESAASPPASAAPTSALGAPPAAAVEDAAHTAGEGGRGPAASAIAPGVRSADPEALPVNPFGARPRAPTGDIPRNPYGRGGPR
jgi:serine/threonine-protein kinase